MKSNSTRMPGSFRIRCRESRGQLNVTVAETEPADGSQDATPAFPVYSPLRHIDRSLLPKADENVVVDVNVSALGEVLDEKLVHGLGTSVDQTILDTVRSWKFHPATVDGNACVICGGAGLSSGPEVARIASVWLRNIAG